MGLVKFFCGTESGDEGPEGVMSRRVQRVVCVVDRGGVPVVTSYDDSTRSRIFTLLDEIRFGETLPFVCCPELLSEVIVADATGVDDGIWGQDILGKSETMERSDARANWGRTAAPRAAFCAAPPATKTTLCSVTISS